MENENDKKHTLTRRYWLITYNNPPEDWKAALQSLGSQWGIGQLEQGEQGTQHIQAVLWFRDKLANTFWKGKPVWAKAIYSDQIDQTVTYCTKEETRLSGPWHFGTMPNHCKSSERVRRTVRDFNSALDLAKEGRIKEIEAAILIPYVTNLQKIAHLYGDEKGTDRPRGVWIVGQPGTGKSHYARDNYAHAYNKAQNKWWDGYSGQEFVLLDDLDQLGSCLSHYLKIWLDKYPFSGEIKGGHVATSYRNFIITSNYWPHQLFTDETVCQAITRRCIFIHFFEYAKFNIGGDFGVKPPANDDININYFGQFINNYSQ